MFRLFKGEHNVRNSRGNAARIEAFSNLEFQRGDWHEWEGTYTIIKPHSGAIFQSKNSDNGHDYEAYLNGKKVGQGQYDRPEGHTDFRWGMYVGGKTLVKHDAMIFVTGVRFEEPVAV